MDPILFFNCPEYLEPHCPKCRAKLEYGVNTKFVAKAKTHQCLNCGTLLE